MSHDTTPASTVSTAVPYSAHARSGFYQSAVLRSLAGLRRGHLHLELPDGTRHDFGAGTFHGSELAHDLSARHIPPSARLRVRSPDFFRQCVLFGDIGFAESYLAGDWETDSLTAIIGWFILNLEDAPTLSGSRNKKFLLNLLRGFNRLGHLFRPNSRATARCNISAHYDLSNDFFALFLDPAMMYSSAKWSRPDLTLAEAQAEKNDALCRKLRLQPSDHVLEIGTGWGGWSLHAARHYGCKITTLTISQQQYDHATARIAAAGLAGRIEVRLQDYREVTGQFDKIVSIEMLEAVGHGYLATYCATLARVLKRDGLLGLQFITCPDSRYGEFRRGVDFIQKHIFPGSLLLSLNRVNALLQHSGDFVVHSVEDFGRDYARTLRLWREAFNRRLDEVRALGFDDPFIRKWNYYLSYCEAAFALRNISVVQTVHTRPNNLAL